MKATQISNEESSIVQKHEQNMEKKEGFFQVSSSLFFQGLEAYVEQGRVKDLFMGGMKLGQLHTEVVYQTESAGYPFMWHSLN